MTKVEALEEQIEKLTPEEWAELRNWVLDRDAKSASRFSVFDIPVDTPRITAQRVQQALDEDGI